MNKSRAWRGWTQDGARPQFGPRSVSGTSGRRPGHSPEPFERRARTSAGPSHRRRSQAVHPPHSGATPANPEDEALRLSARDIQIAALYAEPKALLEARAPLIQADRALGVPPMVIGMVIAHDPGET